MKIAERGQHPSASPFPKARDAEIVEAAACKPALTRCESGRALHFGAIVQQQDDAMALRRSGCNSPWLHFFHRARGRQQSAPFGSANAWRGSALVQTRSAICVAAGAANTRGSTFSPALPTAACPFRLLGGARPFQIPPKRWKRRTPLVSARDRCNSGWRIVLPCSSTARAPGSDPGG